MSVRVIDGSAREACVRRLVRVLSSHSYVHVKVKRLVKDFVRLVISFDASISQ